MNTQTSTLELHRLIPPFSLESVEGLTISPWDYKEKRALVLAFFDATGCADAALLEKLKERYEVFKDADIEVLAIAQAPVEHLRTCTETLGLPFPVLSDERGTAHEAYGVTGASLFAADRFGELRAIAALTGDIDAILDHTISTLDLTEMECPECGAPTWE